MSATADTDRVREIEFALGTFTGMFVIALGFAFYLLAISMGVRPEEGGYLPSLLETSVPILGLNVLVFSGLVVLFAGLVGRLYRPKFPESIRPTIKTLSKPAIILGIAVFSFGFSPQTTISAPWLATGDTSTAVAHGVPITVAPLLVGGLFFPIFQLARFRRGSSLFTSGQKRAVVWLSLLLLAIGFLPSIVYVLGLLFGGMTGPEAAQIIPTPVIGVGGAVQKVLLFTFSIEMFLSGWAILRTALAKVGW